MSAAERERDDESHAVASVQGCLEETLHVIRFDWLDLLFFDPRSLGDGDRVASHVAALFGLTERSAGGAVDFGLATPTALMVGTGREGPATRLEH